VILLPNQKRAHNQQAVDVHRLHHEPEPHAQHLVHLTMLAYTVPTQPV
jgi:hypothetical protein